jgi:hypothetical protein
MLSPIVPFEAKMGIFFTYSRQVFSNGNLMRVTSPTRDIRGRGRNARQTSNNHAVNCYQEGDDINKVTQEIASEMPVHGKRLGLSLDLQVAAMNVAICRALVA